MLTSGTAPPSGVKLSCALLTAPVEVPVVEAAKIPETGEPKRASLPSMLEPTAPIASTRGLPSDSKLPASTALPAQRIAIAAKTAQPWRVSRTSRP